MELKTFTNEIKSEYITASEIVCVENVENTSLLLLKTVRQATLGIKNVCVMKNRGYVLLDFGRELCGGVDITVQTIEGRGKLRISFGESVMEALSDVAEKNSTNDHSVRDAVVQIVPYSNFRFGQTGFRFVRIEAIDCNVAFAGIRAVSELRDIEYKGSFESDDTLLNKIWQIGARTVHLNMQNFLLDGIKRDRLVWIGDMHAEVSAVGSVFGYNSVVDKSLDLIKDITPAGEWMNGIASYSLWWLIIRYEWYVYTGDIHYLKKDEKYITCLIKQIADAVTEEEYNFGDSSSDNNISDKYFVDWETNQTVDSKSGFYSILVMALEAGKKLCGIFGNTDIFILCKKKLSMIKSMKLLKSQNRQIASLMALAGLRSVEEVNNEILLKEPVCDISAYLGYYTLIAKGRAGDISGAIDIIKGYWGRMLELGATSFWESFDYVNSFGAVGIDKIVPAGQKDIHGDSGAFCYKGFRCSLCHGWACGPTPFLSRVVLGISPQEAGFKKVSVKPQLGNLLYVSGSFPTPYGNIEIDAEKKNGKVIADIRLPKGVEQV